MSEQEPPRTRLAQLLRQHHVTLAEFRKNYQRAAEGTALSERQAYRWVTGELRGLPYPQAQATLEKMFGEPVARLLGPPYGIGALAPTRCHHEAVPQRGTARTDWKGQVIAMSADRARDFLTRIEASNVGTETFAQLIDDLRRLVIAYEHQPLPTLLSELVDTQDRTFVLLEGRQRPEQTRDLYLIAGIACGLMARASHDLGAAHDAMTQARTGYACADNAGHDRLRAWTRGLQALITHRSGRLEESCSPTSWTLSAGCAPSAGRASSTTPPTPCPGAAQPRPTAPNASHSTRWTPTPGHRPRTGHSTEWPALAARWPSPECSKARSTAPPKHSPRCSSSLSPSAFTGS